MTKIEELELSIERLELYSEREGIDLEAAIDRCQRRLKREMVKAEKLAELEED